MKQSTACREAVQRKLQVCVVFDEKASALSAEVMIRHVAWDYEFELQSFHFDELDAPAPGVAAARSAAGTDILVLAVRDDQDLPTHVRLWMGLCLGMRDEDHDGALVALIIQTGTTKDLDSSLVDYLETVAIIGGLAFFVKRRSGRRCPEGNRNTNRANKRSWQDEAQLSVHRRRPDLEPKLMSAR